MVANHQPAPVEKPSLAISQRNWPGSTARSSPAICALIHVSFALVWERMPAVPEPPFVIPDCSPLVLAFYSFGQAAFT